MGRFLYKIFSILGISLIIGLVLEAIIYFNKSKSFTNGGSAINWTVSEQKFEVGFLGDSRVWAGINPLDSVSSVNLASPGVGYNVLLNKLERYLKYNTIELLAVDFEIFMKPNSREWYQKSHFLKFLFLDHEHLRSYFKSIEGSHDFEYYLPIVRYQGELEQLIKDLVGYSKGSTDALGFAVGARPSFSDTLKTHVYPYKKRFEQNDTALRNSRIRHLDSLASTHGFSWFPFYLPYSPNVIQIDRPFQIQLDSKTIEVLTPQGIEWTFKDFYDYRHLNENGADKVTKSLESQILNLP